MSKPSENYLFQFKSLLGNSLGYDGIGMSMNVYPPRGDGVNNHAAVESVQPGAVSGFNRYINIPLERSKWMPNMFVV